MPRTIQQFNLLPRPLIRSKLMHDRVLPRTPIQVTDVDANLDCAGEGEDSDMIGIPAKSLETLDAKGGGIIVVGWFEERTVQGCVEADVSRGEEPEVNDDGGGDFLVATY